MALIEINRNPPARDLRIFAILQFPLIAWLMWGLMNRTGWTSLPILLTVLSLLVAGIGLIAPARIRLVYVGWMLAFWPVGWLVSHMILGLIYFGVLWPIGLWLRLRGHDPLQLRRSEPGQTFWLPRSNSTDPNSYFRQF